jgi:hypothetical protein
MSSNVTIKGQRLTTHAGCYAVNKLSTGLLYTRPVHSYHSVDHATQIMIGSLDVKTGTN